ncbi:MAG: 5-(carboxyamino)imidazole ribonucleotide synthase [Thermoanaerobacteraceae bacterium]|nr:5-(carboxyamino)imidazole ribonucleotide synthase [Thermoanaerobacteraceae bacterium]
MGEGTKSFLTDVITFEFEHIDADILCDLESEGYAVYPSGKTLKKLKINMNKNRYCQMPTIWCMVNIPLKEESEI